LTEAKGKLTIGCDIVAAHQLPDELLSYLPPSFDPKKVGTLKLGLREILINAVEHGSLEISYDEKTEQTTMGFDYLEFLTNRQKDPRYSDRKVEVEYHTTGEKIVYRITDEGRGFDHRKLRERAASEDVFELAHGRGIIMTYRIFDKVRYNARGNQVTLMMKVEKN